MSIKANFLRGFLCSFVSWWFLLSCAAQAGEPSFRNDIQPILSKAGCNSGACHGAAAGKNGFKLSLRGYDDEGDWRTITRSNFGRRINLNEPAQSLLLLKPTNTVSHKGGQRFPVDSPEYKMLATWIASGAPGPKDADPRIVSIEIRPATSLLKPGDEKQLQVIAHFSDHSERDVTRLAKFTALDASVCTISEDGLVKITGPGESPITAWFLSKLSTATATVPYPNSLPADLFAKSPKRNFIDQMVLAKLELLKLPPSPRCSDSEFIRRAYIDTIGLLPTLEETKSFIANPSPDKRDRLIEELLSRPEFVDYWSYKWSDLLLVSSAKLRPAAMWSYYKWIRDQVAANTPWDQFVRGILTARGSTLEDGAANFYVLHDDPISLTETASLAFMGMSINCAHCHNHPLEKWTNNQYFAYANLFARVRKKMGPGDGEQIIFSDTQGELIQPLTGKPQPPSPLDGTPMKFDDPSDRREKLADWMVSPQNPYFTRCIVNRVWANFMGVGLVEKVDDLRLTNPASDEPLLSALAADLAKNHYDLKTLMRLILQSETYQRSSQALKENAGDTRLYSHYYPRRIMAEALLDSMSQVLAAPTSFPGYPAGWRAMQLPDSNIDSYFLKSFGRADRVATCVCERTDDPSMAQVLHIANGNTLNAKLAAKGNRIDQYITKQTPMEQVIEEAYLWALSRPPTDAERSRLLPVLNSASDKDKRQVIEDLFWSLLSSNEFLFDH